MRIFPHTSATFARPIDSPRRLLQLLIVLFEIIEAFVDGIEAFDNFGVVICRRRVLALDLDERRESDAALQSQHGGSQ